MKKFISVLLIICFLINGLGSRIFLMAEDLPSYCDPFSDDYDERECNRYLLNSSMNSIQDLKKQIEDAESDFETAQALATKYRQEAESLDSEIAELNVQIKELEEKMVQLEASIKENEEKVDELNQRVLSRMESAQVSMHFDPYLDFVLSATGFDDMLRRVYGVEAITSKDKKDREDLKELIEKLQADREQLDKDKIEMDEKKEALTTKRAQSIIMRNYWLEIQEETEAQIEALQNALEDERQNYSGILANISDLSGLPSSQGMTAPVPGASISAGVWRYPASFGGGVHLGIDYAVGIGTTITSPMNGVVIRSSDSCPSYGYLGNGCPYNGIGVAAGGNQVTMIGTAMDSDGDSFVYGVSFFHLQSGSPTGTGVVMQGDYIGKVGSSGNSTGPHCHIELYYLGPGDMSDIEEDYLYRDYSMSFNCGWGAYGLGRLCENGVGAPCRLNPTYYFGQ